MRTFFISVKTCCHLKLQLRQFLAYFCFGNKIQGAHVFFSLPFESDLLLLIGEALGHKSFEFDTLKVNNLYSF